MLHVTYRPCVTYLQGEIGLPLRSSFAILQAGEVLLVLVHGSNEPAVGEAVLAGLEIGNCVSQLAT